MIVVSRFPRHAMSAKFQCDKCGACCQGSLIVEAQWIDVARELRLKEADQYYRDHSIAEVLELLRDEMRVVTLACGYGCPFLTEDKSCSIYPARPNVCIEMEAGDEQCQQARRSAGFPPLSPQ